MTQPEPARQAEPVGHQSSDHYGAFTYKAIIGIGLALAVISLALLGYYIRDILMLVFASILLAVIISWPTNLLQKRTGWRRIWCLLAVLATAVLVIGVSAYGMGTRIAEQVQELKQTLPPAYNNLVASLKTTGWGNWVLEQTVTIRKYLSNADVVGQVQSVLSSTFGVLGNMVLVLLVAVYLALAPAFYRDGLVLLVPVKARPRAKQILEKLGSTLQWWFFGQLCSMTAIATLTFIGLKIRGIPLALTLGILAGLLNFVPNFGPIIASIPALVIALAPHGSDTSLNWNLAIYVAILYMAVQAAEGSLITPLIQKRAVDLPPALIVVFQVVLGILVGPLGLVFATPVLAALVVLVRMIYVEDILGDKKAER